MGLIGFIFWILVFVYIDGGSFRDSLKTARKMARMGEKIIFLEEFLGVKEIFVGFFLWLAQIVKYLFLEKKFDDEILCGGTLSPSCIPIIQEYNMITTGIYMSINTFPFSIFDGLYSSWFSKIYTSGKFSNYHYI